MRNFRLRVPRQVVTLLLAILTATLVVLVWPPDRFIISPVLHTIHSLEWNGYDVLELFGPRQRRVDPRIVIIGYDRTSEVFLGAYPPKRHVHAKLLQQLTQDGAALIVYDTLFSDPSTPDEDRKLDAALQKAGNVVLACRVDNDESGRMSLETPYYDPNDVNGVDFEAHARMIGFTEIAKDQLGRTSHGATSDQVLRRIVPIRKDPADDNYLPSLSSAAYLVLNNATRAQIRMTPDAVMLHTLAIPRTGPNASDIFNAQMPSSYIDFPGGRATIPIISFERAVTPKALPPGTFRDKIVFIGLTGAQLTQANADRYTTSATHFHPAYEDSTHLAFKTTDIPGVMIHAQMFNALLTRGFIHFTPIWACWLIVFVFAFGAIWLTRRFIDWRGPVLLTLSAAAYLVSCYGIFYQWSTYQPMLIPLVLVILTAGIVSWTERGSLRKMWSGYVSPAVLEHILRTGAEQGAQQYVGTIIFGDIRNFTGFSEAHDAPTVVRLLNRHLERLTTIVYDEQGTVDKFLGDGILVVFGAPVPQEDGAVRAVRAAYRMRDISLQPFPDDDGTPYTLSSGFGVTTGPFVAGHVGSRQRHDFSVIGDTVNLSARLQGVTGKPDVIIDEPTFERVRAHVEVESLGEVTLKGKAHPVQCYRVLTWSDTPRVEATE